MSGLMRFWVVACLVGTAAVVAEGAKGPAPTPVTPSFTWLKLGEVMPAGWIKAQIRWNTGRVSEQDHLEWFENTRVTRLQGNDPIRWADVEPAPAATESTSPEASDERDRGF